MDERAEFKRHRDDGYRALGRYFTEFSELVSIMEEAIAGYLQRCGVPPETSRLPCATHGADGMLGVFFALSRNVHDHSERELQIAKKLKLKVRDEFPFRNDAAHGAWIMGGTIMERDGLVPSPPVAFRTKPHREAGATVMVKDDLDERSETLLVLQRYLHQYALACFRGRGEIQDYVRLTEAGALTPGPVGAPSHAPPHESQA